MQLRKRPRMQMEPRRIELASMSIYQLVSSPETPVKKHFYDRIWVPAVALATALYLIYSPVFLTDYLINDEWEFIGSRQGLRQGAINAFFFWGRGLFGIYS